MTVAAALRADSDAEMNRSPLLSARSVVVSYGRTPALRGVTMSVGGGEIVAVTGASGSGKSTLLLCLAGILRPDVGEVRFGDRVISAESEAARSRLRRREFGVLFQFGQLVPELSAVENVALPLLLSGFVLLMFTSFSIDVVNVVMLLIVDRVIDVVNGGINNSAFYLWSVMPEAATSACTTTPTAAR